MSMTTLELAALPRSNASRAFRRFRRHRLAMLGAVTIALLFLAAFVGPYVLPFDDTYIDIMHRFEGPFSGAHILGTDELGRDMLARLMMGGRISLLGIPSQPVTLELAEDVIFKGVTVQGINGRRIWRTWYQAQALLRSGKVDLSPLITHTLPLAEIEKGMALLSAGQAAKIILCP